MTAANKFLLALGLMLCALGVRAQSVKWSVPPEYDAIEQVSEKLYKVTTVKGEGLVSADGKVIVDPGSADKISDFSEGFAIAMKADAKTKIYRLTGIISEDGEMLVPPGEFYIGDYPFFSEGFLPVFNKKGAYGFLDKEGGLAVDFKYSTVHPFCQGYALVGLGKPSKNGSSSGDPLESKDPVTYVDKNGVEIPLDKSLGKIYFGTSFYNGEAVVKTKKGSFCTIGTSGEVIQLDVKPFGLFSAPKWYFDGINLLQGLAKTAVEHEFVVAKLGLLDRARRKTTQKVNLFEKVQIPGFQEAIRKIKRFMEDEENLSKSSQKILKALQEKRKQNEEPETTDERKEDEV